MRGTLSRCNDRGRPDLRSALGPSGVTPSGVLPAACCSAPLHPGAERLDEDGQHANGEPEAVRLCLHGDQSFRFAARPPGGPSALRHRHAGTALYSGPPARRPSSDVKTEADVLQARARAADHPDMLIGLVFLLCLTTVPLAR